MRLVSMTSFGLDCYVALKCAENQRACMSVRLGHAAFCFVHVVIQSRSCLNGDYV
jgi:hypothetical protein